MSGENIKLKRDIDFTARYTVVSIDGGYRFLFFCTHCDSGYATEFIRAESLGAALDIAAKEARTVFNYCRKCAKWVCDYHYNMEKSKCTLCTPLEANSEQISFLKRRDVGC